MKIGKKIPARKKMGAGASTNQILTSLEARYKENPTEITSVVKLCQEKIDALAREKAIRYAKQMSYAFVPPSQTEMLESFTLLDFNGNGIVSLAEIDKYITERYPVFNNKPALIRAMKMADTDKNGFITQKEYHCLFRYIKIYNDLWCKFEKMDKNGDRRIDRDEFNIMAVSVFGEESVDFDALDTNNGGVILFKEFCDYVIRKKCKQ